jgi:peptide deformylase
MAPEKRNDRASSEKTIATSPNPRDKKLNKQDQSVATTNPNKQKTVESQLKQLNNDNSVGMTGNQPSMPNHIITHPITRKSPPTKDGEANSE